MEADLLSKPTVGSSTGSVKMQCSIHPRGRPRPARQVNRLAAEMNDGVKLARKWVICPIGDLLIRCQPLTSGRSAKDGSARDSRGLGGSCGGMAAIKVLLADDHRLIIEAVRCVLEAAGDFEVVG